MEVLKAENITKQYAGHKALDNVSISVPQGSIYGLLGPNGAGKTTLIRIINRITAPDSGCVYLNGKPMTTNDVYNIGYLPEERGLYKKMKVGEEALYFAQLKGMSKKAAMDRLKYWFKRFEIQGWWDKKVEELSKGMAQKVQFIVTVVHDPDLLILDEPFSGFDPINANLLKDEILELKRNGTTIILSTHNMSSVEEVCDNITLINKSRDILSGRVDEIRRTYGSGVYQIDFEGDKTALSTSLAGICQVIEVGDVNSQLKSLQVKIGLGEAPRSVISAANSLVSIHNFSETIPSMNDIFIQTVNNNR